MKKLLAFALCMILLLGAMACDKSEPPVNTPTPPETTDSSSVSDVGGATPPSSMGEIANRSHLLNGKTLEEKAIFLWNGLFEEESIIDDTVDSATMEAVIAAKGTSADLPGSIDATMKFIYVEGSGQIKPFSLMEGTTTFKMDDLGEWTRIAKTGYADGKIFEYVSDGDEGYALFAEHTAAEWEEYQLLGATDEGEMIPVMKPEYCATKAFNWVGQTYEIAFSDFTEEGMESMNEMLGDMTELFDEVPTDMTLRATFRRDLLPTEMTVEYVYAEDVDANFVMTYRFKDYNKTQAVEVDLSEYTDVKDLLSVARLMEKQNELEEADASFRYRLTYKVFQDNRVLGSSTGSYAIEHGEKEDGYWYRAVDETDGDTYSYANGTYYADTENGEYEQAISEAQARAQVRQYIDAFDTDFSCILFGETETRGSNKLLVVHYSEFGEEWLETLIGGIPNATLSDIRDVGGHVLYTEDASGGFGRFTYTISITLSVNGTIYTANTFIDVEQVVLK